MPETAFATKSLINRSTRKPDESKLLDLSTIYWPKILSWAHYLRYGKIKLPGRMAANLWAETAESFERFGDRKPCKILAIRSELKTLSRFHYLSYEDAKALDPRSFVILKGWFRKTHPVQNPNPFASKGLR